MARKTRKSKLKELRYFFLNEKVHKVLRASRSKDEVIAWHYESKKRVLYSYSQVEKNMSKAYSISEVASLLNKHRITIEDYILEGKIKTPVKIYSISDPDNKNWSKYLFSESDILDIHQYIILYTKTDNGFVPVWKA